MSGLVPVTPPAIEPIPLAEGRLHLRLDATSGSPASHPDDTLVSAYITTGREILEQELNRKFITQTWEYVLDLFPTELVLPFAPVQTIDLISYIDSDGNTQTLAADQYVLDSASTPPWVLPADGVSWPATRGVANAVTLTLTAGYGDNAEDVPAPLRAAIKLIVGDMYANREPVVSDWRTVDRLKAAYKVWIPSQ